MYEIYCQTVDDYGSCCGPTGDGSVNLNVAEQMLSDYQQEHSDSSFYIVYTQSEDHFNCY